MKKANSERFGLCKTNLAVCMYLKSTSILNKGDPGFDKLMAWVNSIMHFSNYQFVFYFIYIYERSACSHKVDGTLNVMTNYKHICYLTCIECYQHFIVYLIKYLICLFNGDFS